MKKALAIVNGFTLNQNNLYKIQRLKEELSFYQIELETKDAISLLPYCYGDKIEIPFLQDYLFAIDLDKDRYLAKAISDYLPLYNSYEAIMLSDDKMSSILALKGTKIPVPLTIPAPLCYAYHPDPKKEKEFLDKVEEALSYPLVFKECHGSLGAQVKLIHNREELEAIYQEKKETPHLYEKFLSSHIGHDYRIIVIGDKAVACMERINQHDFRSNIALGGIGKDVTNTLSPAFISLAEKATRALKLDYAGIDVAIQDDGSPCFLEANGNAFFTEIEKVTKVNVTKLLVEHILKKEKIL